MSEGWLLPCLAPVPVRLLTQTEFRSQAWSRGRWLRPLPVPSQRDSGLRSGSALRLATPPLQLASSDANQSPGSAPNWLRLSCSTSRMRHGLAPVPELELTGSAPRRIPANEQR